MIGILPTKILVSASVPLSLSAALIFGTFLFWRASKYELVDPQDIFDVMLLFGVGALLGGRIGDFLVRYDYYQWSFFKLFFFNSYWGLDFYFAVLGGIVAAWIYLKNKKENFWFVADLAGAPFVFSLSLYYGLAYTFVVLVKGSFVFESRELVFFGSYF